MALFIYRSAQSPVKKLKTYTYVICNVEMFWFFFLLLFQLGKAQKVGRSNIRHNLRGERIENNLTVNDFLEREKYLLNANNE